MTITRVKEKMKHLAKWDEAIADAKRKITDLRFTVKTYTRMKESGEPWPGGVQELDRKRHANG